MPSPPFPPLGAAPFVTAEADSKSGPLGKLVMSNLVSGAAAVTAEPPLLLPPFSSSIVPTDPPD